MTQPQGITASVSRAPIHRRSKETSILSRYGADMTFLEIESRRLKHTQVSPEIHPLEVASKQDGVHIRCKLNTALLQSCLLTEASPGSDGHQSIYDWDWLSKTQNPVTSLYRETWEKTPWTVEVLSASELSTVDFGDVMDPSPENKDEGMKRLMGNIVRV